MKQGSNKGFTLVEIIVVVCILAIVGSVVLSIISSGTTSYTRSTNNISLQNEAQMAINQVQELMIDATNGVTYELDGIMVLNDGEFASGSLDSVTTKAVRVYNQVSEGGSHKLICSEIKWIKDTRKIVYAEYEWAKDALGNYSLIAEETDNLMAQNVERFALDLSKLESDGIATVEMAFSLKDQSFQASKCITLRNKVVVNKSMDEIYRNVSGGIGRGSYMCLMLGGFRDEKG